MEPSLPCNPNFTANEKSVPVERCLPSLEDVRDKPANEEPLNVEEMAGDRHGQAENKNRPEPTNEEPCHNLLHKIVLVGQNLEKERDMSPPACLETPIDVGSENQWNEEQANRSVNPNIVVQNPLCDNTTEERRRKNTETSEPVIIATSIADLTDLRMSNDKPSFINEDLNVEMGMLSPFDNATGISSKHVLMHNAIQLWRVLTDFADKLAIYVVNATDFVIFVDWTP